MKARIILLTAAFVSGAALVHAATANENWENYCAKCHGTDGKGNTKVGKKLNVKDYTNAKIQDALKDEDMLKAISDGVAEGGKEKMKGFKNDLSAQDMSELVGYIRKFRKH